MLPNCLLWDIGLTMQMQQTRESELGRLRAKETEHPPWIGTGNAAIEVCPGLSVDHFIRPLGPSILLID